MCVACPRCRDERWEWKKLEECVSRRAEADECRAIKSLFISRNPPGTHGRPAKRRARQWHRTLRHPQTLRSISSLTSANSRASPFQTFLTYYSNQLFGVFSRAHKFALMRRWGWSDSHTHTCNVMQLCADTLYRLRSPNYQPMMAKIHIHAICSPFFLCRSLLSFFFGEICRSSKQQPAFDRKISLCKKKSEIESGPTGEPNSWKFCKLLWFRKWIHISFFSLVWYGLF